MSTKEIYNYIKVNEQLSTGGQPTEEQLRSAAAEGFTSVINLATNDEGDSLKDEAGLVGSLGMQYTHIPVVWENPTEKDFQLFESAMQALPTGKTLIHCAANYRVTAFYALYAQKNLGWSEAQAEAFRAQIWKDSKNPAWEEFISRMRRKIANK